MSWGTSFKTEVYLSRMSFDSQYELEHEIDELRHSIDTSREVLSMLAIANPRDIVTEDEDPIYSLKNRVADQVELIEDNAHKLALLQLYLTEVEEGRVTITKQTEL